MFFFSLSTQRKLLGEIEFLFIWRGCRVDFHCTESDGVTSELRDPTSWPTHMFSCY
jgi:hypothetical protein